MEPLKKLTVLQVLSTIDTNRSLLRNQPQNEALLPNSGQIPGTFFSTEGYSKYHSVPHQQFEGEMALMFIITFSSTDVPRNRFLIHKSIFVCMQKLSGSGVKK